MEQLLQRTRLNFSDVPDPRGQSAPDTPRVADSALTEEIDDRVASLLVAGTNITLTYDDPSGTLTIAAAGGSGTVTSVSGAGTVSGLTLTGTVTTSGSLTLGGTLSVLPGDFGSQGSNRFIAAPTGAAGLPTFRKIALLDLPFQATGTLLGNVSGANAAPLALTTAQVLTMLAFTYATVAASYTETATTGEKVVTVTASGQTVTLPTAVGNKAKLTFKLMVAGTLTLDGAGAETIDGAATAVLTMQYEALTLVSDNANWIAI